MSKRLLFCLIILLLSTMTFSGCGGGPALLIRPVKDTSSLRETVLQKDSGWFVWDKIAVIDVDGVLSNSSPSGFLASGENPVSLFVEKLDRAAGDDRVKAVVLRINSPGGSVAASDMMYHALMEFRARTSKPVITCMLDLAASGGYYLACGTDGIVAGPSTVTGSIGTIMQTVSFAGTMRMLGINAVAIKSGKLKDMASPLHDLKPDEKEVLQKIIMQFYNQFVAVVVRGRQNLTEEKIRQLADGRVYTGPEALKNGLVDKIGYPRDALKWAAEMAGVKKAKVVIYHRPFNYVANLYGTSAATAVPPAKASLINIPLPHWLSSAGTQFLYMWQGAADK